MTEDAGPREHLQQAEAELSTADARIAAISAQIDAGASSLKAGEATRNYTRIYAPRRGSGRW